jgi:hypothetical protein
MSHLHDKADEAVRIEKAQAILDRALERLIRKLDRAVTQLEIIGENDIGLLNYKFADRYHAATETMRIIVRDLTSDV